MCILCVLLWYVTVSSVPFTKSTWHYWVLTDPLVRHSLAHALSLSCTCSLYLSISISLSHIHALYRVAAYEKPADYIASPAYQQQPQYAQPEPQYAQQPQQVTYGVAPQAVPAQQPQRLQQPHEHTTVTVVSTHHHCHHHYEARVPCDAWVWCILFMFVPLCWLCLCRRRYVCVHCGHRR
jgi:hypothetical protein